MKKALSANQLRAVGLLSQGMNLSEAADRCNVCRATLHRWKNNPDFKASLEKNVNETMGASIQQIQNTARNLIEGGLEAARELRYLVLNERSPAHVRRLAANDILRYEQRWLDILGFNAKSVNPRKLIDEGYDEEAETLPERVPDAKDCADGDGDQKPIEQLTPEPPLMNRNGPPAIGDVWKLDPVEPPEAGTWTAIELEQERAKEREAQQAAAAEELRDAEIPPAEPDQVAVSGDDAALPEPQIPETSEPSPSPEPERLQPFPRKRIPGECDGGKPGNARRCNGNCQPNGDQCNGSTCNGECATDRPPDKNRPQEENGLRRPNEDSDPIRDD